MKPPDSDRPIVRHAAKPSTLASQEAEATGEREVQACVHILSVSSGMLGVCLTVIGLIRVIITLKSQDTMADDLLVLDSIVFLLACITSYGAIRTDHRAARVRLAKWADCIFLAGLTIMVGVCGYITYAIL